jgi:hypothetical protein
MRRRTLLLAAGAAGSLGLPGAARTTAVAVQVETAFDVPGVGNSTTPFHISRRGDIAGDYVDTAGVRRGFVRLSDGRFSAPLVAAGDTGNFTRALGINIARVVTGEYINVADNTSHAFFMLGSRQHPYDVPGFASTGVFGINDLGNFCGGSDNALRFGPVPDRAFASFWGSLVEITVPGAFDAIAFDIDNLHRVVGTYRDASLVRHGFLRSPLGRLTLPIEPPGAMGTFLLGINDRGWMVGRYADTSGTHGFLFKRPDRYLSFDYPGAIETSLNGINNDGLISGRYNGSDGLRHGFLARLVGDDDD